ncbi:beta-catenin-like protein 1 [Sitodiplosis mosellana]|uniref:beta-catenin-like protein 1 n=1 Tax=Sitodiplosis mosellana TaxID=263140 RepID=UPI002443B304|nr:beta-catenin-like protein 1 [Sitodiplosis mosellana]
MDIGELLSYKPEQTPKRPNEDQHSDDDDDDAPEKNSNGQSRKKQRTFEGRSSSLANSRAQVHSEPELTEEERLNILRYVEEEEAADYETLDENGLRKMVLLFEKRNLRNQEMRIKFPDNPEKFMESEIELHAVINDLKVVATVPDLYPLLVDPLNAIPSLLELLAHQNTDISVAVIDLLQELTDVDILHESLEGAEVLINCLRKQQICALLVQILDRLDEHVREESDGVHNSLAIFENLSEIHPSICKEAASQGLLQWLVKRLKQKGQFNPNKLYCSEILSILVQDDDEIRLQLGALDGIDVLLQQLAAYKRHDPTSTEEQEYMENLFNCLCSSLMAKENRDRFLKGEGLQLMNLMLREKKLSRNGSLKVLDHAMSGPDGKENCNKFVDILGLRTIFPLFMNTPKKSKKRVISRESHEEHVLSIIASMLRNCKGSQRQRLLSKFTENEFEKVERLLELHLKYLDKVDAIDAEIDEDNEEDEIYLKRLSGGLFTLQLIDYIILEISATSESIKQHVVKILNLRKASMKRIRHIMREYAGNLGDTEDNEWRDQEQQHIIQLVDRF